MDRIARLLDDALTSGLGSCAAVSVGDAGREVFGYVTGTTRRVPDRGPAASSATVFDLASVTKPMATVAIAMVLVAERRLDLEAPVRRYLPDAATSGSVRQLLGHTAGCAAHVEFFRRLRVEQHADPYAVLVARAQREPCSAPGVSAVYSDTPSASHARHRACPRCTATWASSSSGPSSSARGTLRSRSCSATSSRARSG